MKLYHLFLCLFLIACGNSQGDENSNKTSQNNIVNSITINQDKTSLEPASVSVNIDSTDTVVIGGHVLHFKPTRKVEFPDYYHNQQAVDSLAKVFTNSHDLALAHERLLKEKYKSIFSTTDSILTIKMKDGSNKSFPRVGDTEKGIYSFDSYFQEIDLVLLYVQYYEGNEYYLLYRKTGEGLFLIGKPYFSKDYSRFIAINCDLDASYTTNGIALYTLEGDRIKQEFIAEVSPWGPQKAMWVDDNNIILEVGYPTPSDKSSYFQKYLLMTVIQ